MGDFKRGGFGGGRSGGFKKGGFSGGGRGSFGGGRGGFGGGRDNRGPVEMFPAVCAECGKNCKVPFRPSNDKPIYCNDCFGSKRDSQPRSDFRGRDRGSDFPPRDTKDNGNDELKRKIESIEKKLDTIIDLLGEIEIVDEEVEEKEEKKSKKKS